MADLNDINSKLDDIVHLLDSINNEVTGGGGLGGSGGGLGGGTGGGTGGTGGGTGGGGKNLANTLQKFKAYIRAFNKLGEIIGKVQGAWWNAGFAKAVAEANYEVGKLTASLESWKNSMSGAESALKIQMENIKKLRKVEMENQMNIRKMQQNVAYDTLDAAGELVPVVGPMVSNAIKLITKPFVDLSNQLLEQQMKEVEERLNFAEQYVTKGQEVAKNSKEYLANVDKEIMGYSRRNSLSVEQTKLLRDTELAHNEMYASLNKGAEDAVKIFSGLRERTGRALNMSLEETMLTLAAGNIVGDDVVAQTQSELYLFNKSAGYVANMMVNTQNTVGKMGLSTQKVMKSITDNWKLAQEFQFRNGTEGLKEMTILAENLRFNMSSMSGMLNKIQNGGLEGVIKQSAQLQVLGGNMGMGADPFALAYNAFQDPAQMMKNISHMLRGFGTFNAKTGETDFAINEQIRLGAFAEAMGMSKGDAMNMIREQNKKDLIKGMLTDSSFTNEQMDAISNLATRNANGNWTVKTIDGEEIDVRNLNNKGDLNRLLSNNKDDQAIQYAREQLTTTEEIEKTTKLINAAVGGGLWEDYEEYVNKANEQTQDAYMDSIGELQDSTKDIFQKELDAQNSSLGVLKDFRDRYFASQQEMKIQNILAKDEDDITDADREIVKNELNERLMELIGKYDTIAESDIFDPATGRLNDNVFDAKWWRDKTNGEEKLPPIAAHELEKLGLWTIGGVGYETMQGDFVDLLGGLVNGVTFTRIYNDIATDKRFWEQTNGFNIDEHTFDGLPDYYMTGGELESIKNPMLTGNLFLGGTYDIGHEPQRVNDGAIFSNGEVRAITNPSDNIYVAKKGGILQNALEGAGIPGKMELTLNGTIRLEGSNGESVNLNELSRNPIFIRNLSQMIADSLKNKENGGRLA